MKSPKRILYFDCRGGISGNMIIGSLLDLGISTNILINELHRLEINNWRLKLKKTKRSGINTTHIDFIVGKNYHSRSLKEILGVIDKSSLKPRIKFKAKKIFRLIGAAEAKIHNEPVNNIRLHELGGEDTILDVTGALILIDFLNISKIYISPLPLGKGKIKCCHGTLPLPAPAVLELLKGIPVYSVKTLKETVTPTGAAIAVTVADKFRSFPPIRIKKTGYGSGSYEIKGLPSYLRAILGYETKSIHYKNKRNRDKTCA